MLNHNNFYKWIMEDKDACFSDDDLFEATRMFIEDRDFVKGIELNQRASEIVKFKYENNFQIYASKLTTINLNLGACYELNRQYDSAIQSFCDSITVAKKAYECENNDENKKLIALGLYYLAGHLLYINRGGEAIKPYIIATKLFSEIKTDEEVSVMLHDIAKHLHDIYTTYQGEGVSASRWEYEELIEDLYTYEQLKKLARKYEIEGNIFEDDYETELAKERYLLSHSLRHILLLHDQNPMTIHEYAFGKIRLGNIALLESKKREAKFWYERAICVLNTFPEYANDFLVELDLYIATESLNRHLDRCVKRRSPQKEVPYEIHTRCETATPNFFKNALIITGPSGVGKSTVAEILQQRFSRIKKVISATTRPPRPNEVDGIDYVFMSKEDFESKNANGDFLETTFYNDNYYGILKKEIENCEDETLLFVVDTIGAKNLKTHFPLATTVFIKPPSIEVLEDRIKKRNTNTPEQIEWRLSEAKRELDEADTFDFVVINDSVADCAEKIITLIKR